MLTHAEVIIATPHRDIARLAFGRRPDCVRILTIFAFDINKSAITPFIMKAGYCGVEFCVKIQVIVPVSCIHQATDEWLWSVI